MPSPLSPSLVRMLLSKIVSRLLFLPLFTCVVCSGLLFTSASFAASDDIFELIEQGNLKQARKAVAAQLKSSPDDASALFANALIADKSGQSTKAISLYIDLIEAHPKMMGPYNNLAIHYANAGDFNSAIEILERGLNSSASVKTTYRNLTSIYARMASAAYKKALNSDSPSPPLKLAAIEDAGDTDAIVQQPTLVASAENFIEQSLNESAIQDQNTGDPDPSTEEKSPSIVIAAANAQSKPALVQTETSAAAEPEEADTGPAPTPAPQVEIAVVEPVQQAEQKQAEPEPEVAENSIVIASVQPSAEAKKLAEKSAAEKQAVINHVKSWANAWSDRDVDRYLTHYSNKFSPRSGMSLDDWKQQRYGRLRWREFIIVKPSKYSIEISENIATVNFNQYYKSERFEDTIRKTLELRKENGGWKITRELI